MGHDVDTARHAGITSIAVLTGYDSAAKLERFRPDLMVRDLERLDFLFRRAGRPTAGISRQAVRTSKADARNPINKGSTTVTSPFATRNSGPVF